MIPTLEEIRQAYAATRAATQETPLLEAPAMAAAAGARQVFVKPESLQWAGSFKIRGVYLSPTTDVIAVEPKGYDGMGASLACGEIQRVASGLPTICDALQATRPGAAPFAAAKAAGVRGLTVGDAEVRRALLFAFEKLKLVLEPSGAVALAALLSGAVDAKGKRVLVYLTGGNVSLPAFMAHVEGLNGS